MRFTKLFTGKGSYIYKSKQQSWLRALVITPISLSERFQAIYYSKKTTKKNPQRFGSPRKLK